MKRSLTSMVLLAGALALGGCVDDYGGGYGGVYSAGAYPYYGNGYYGGYPGGYSSGGYYRGQNGYRGDYYRNRDDRRPAVRPAPRPNWNGGEVRGNDRGDRGWNARNNDWSRNPAGSGNNGAGNGGRWHGRR